ncbi:hypothetical protein [Deinococcus cellulosilyticus]|nr:hypothetical protein [Deinococcus cellulosilyticus]
MEQLREMAFKKARFDPESDLQICEFLGEFEKGLAVYESLMAPGAADDRWAGLCHLAHGNRERALECLFRSVERGCHAAKIDLARVLFICDRVEECQKELQEIEPQGLSRFNQAMYFRVTAIHRSAFDLVEAAKLSERSWRVIQSADEFVFAAPRILHTLAYIYQTAKKPEKTDLYLSRAEEICVTRFKWHIKLTRLDLLFDLNRFDEARELCAELIDCPYPLIKSSGMTVMGCIELSLWNPEKARGWFEMAWEYAGRHNMYDNHFISLSYLVMVYHAQGHASKVQLALREMQKYADNANFNQKFLLRKTWVKGSYQQEDVVLLREVEAFWLRAGNPSEVLRTRIYRLSMSMKLGLWDEDVLKELDQIVEHMIAEGLTHEFSEEWLFVPELFEMINRRHGNLLSVPAGPHIKILSIDREALEIHGAMIKLPFKKSFELIVYLCIKKEASLDGIAVDVFGDMPRDRARNYFHQIRHVINHKIKSITITYDRSTRMYALKSEHRLSLDVAPHLEGQKRLEGIFLPSSDSDWVIELNQRLGE